MWQCQSSNFVCRSALASEELLCCFSDRFLLVACAHHHLTIREIDLVEVYLHTMSCAGSSPQWLRRCVLYAAADVGVHSNGQMVKWITQHGGPRIGIHFCVCFIPARNPRKS